MLDVRTLVTTLAGISVLLLFLGVFGIERGLRTRGLNAWAWALAVNCVAMVFLALRGKVPYAVYMLGPVLTHFIPMLQSRALDHALEERRSLRGWAIGAGAACVVTVSAGLLAADADLRAMLFGAYFVAAYGWLSWRCWVAYLARRLRPLLWLLVGFSLYMALFVYRIGMAATVGIGGDSVGPTAINRLTYIGGLFMLLSGSVSFLMLEMAQLQRKLSLAAMQDGLTGLLNRRGFEPHAEKAHHLHVRGGRHYSIVVFDIDHFKQVNDRHGHQAGDKVLVHVAGLLHSGLRASDSLARFGGEEFVALLPDTDAASAASTADRLRATVHARPAVLDSGESIAVSVSAGVAQSNAQHWSGIFKEADSALYRAKAEGRDRVITFTRPAPGIADPQPHAS